MTDYVWCHGPNCHKRTTTNRVRGVKGSKVLRTIKIPVSDYRTRSIWKYFCDQTCMHDFIRTHVEEKQDNADIIARFKRGELNQAIN